MKTILMAFVILISTPAFADKDWGKDGMHTNIKLPMYTRQVIESKYGVSDKSELYVYAQPFTLSSQIHAKKRILYVAVMQSKTQSLYTTIDTNFIISNGAEGEVRGHCLNHVGDGKKKEADKNPTEFLYMFFEFNRAQSKVNFHKIILHEDDPTLRDKFEAMYAICNDSNFSLATKIKIGNRPETQLQDILPELKQPILQFDSTQFEIDKK